MGQRMLRFNTDAIVKLFTAGVHAYNVVREAVPPDAKVVDAKMNFSYSLDSEDAGIVLESAEWPDIPEGQVIQFFTPEIEPLPV